MRHSPHRWRYLSRKHPITSVLVLERAQTKHELDTVARVAVDVTGTLAECSECGCLALWGHRVDEAGQRHELALFGVDLDAMTPTRTPPCERLSLDTSEAA